MGCRKKKKSSLNDRKIKFHIWPIQDSSKPASELFPEQISKDVVVTADSVGIAASGGGSRSHVFTAGYLRGLHQLALLDDVTYLSSVSGGSWVSSIFTYSDKDIEELLGKSLPPERCDRQTLKVNDPGKLPRAVEYFLRSFQELMKGYRNEKGRNWWARFIGTSLLDEFGLKKKVFAFSEEHKNDIVALFKENQVIDLSADSVVVPHKDRPFLIINGVLSGPRKYTSGWGSPLQFTPIYAGVPFYANNDYSWHVKLSCTRVLGLFCFHRVCCQGYGFLKRMQDEQIEAGEKEGISDSIENCSGSLRLVTGGGVISTHAFGTKELVGGSEGYYGGKSLTGFLNNDEPFYLEDAIGISSAAFVSFFANLAVLPVNLVPKMAYMPVLKKYDPKFDKKDSRNIKNDPTRGIVRGFGDGGNFENTGILPLVQRGLKKIIAFINTGKPLLSRDTKFIPGTYKYNKKYCADSQLLALFGAVDTLHYSCNYTLNQIFAKKDLDGVMKRLLENRDVHGKGAVAKIKLKTVKNPYWNIQEGLEIEMLFIYNDRCQMFLDALPQSVKKKVEKKTPRYKRPLKVFGSISDFPHYKTTNGDFMRAFSLSRKEINLATAHAEYLIATANREEVLSMFPSSTSLVKE